MPLYVYIDESGKLFHENKYQNYTAVVFTNSKLLRKFEEEFRKAVELIGKQNPELIAKNEKEIKGSELWVKKYISQQKIILESLERKKSFMRIFSVGVDLTGCDKDYWENEEQCRELWIDMKQWLINDVVIKYYGDFINRCHEKFKEKFTINVYVDKETIKETFKKEIIQMLEQPPSNLSEKVKIFVSIGLDSKYYPGIQLADIIANGLQRDHKKSNSLKQFRKVFEETTKLEITIAKTWRLAKKQKNVEHSNVF